jgi:histidinol dehydrogenase
MRILDWNTLDKRARRAALARPQHQMRAEVSRIAGELVQLVREEGDRALRALTRRFDGALVKSIAVHRNEFAEARRSLSGSQMSALERAIENVQRFNLVILPYTSSV